MHRHSVIELEGE